MELETELLGLGYPNSIEELAQVHLRYVCYRVLEGGGCPRGGCNWGILRIPREDRGTLGNIMEY